MHDHMVANMLLVVVFDVACMWAICAWCKPVVKRSTLKSYDAVVVKHTIRYSMEEIGRAFRRM